jgi:hypothetical protein
VDNGETRQGRSARYAHLTYGLTIACRRRRTARARASLPLPAAPEAWR